MFVVMKKFGRNETRVANYSKEQEAISAILEKLKEDKSYKLDATYCLYEGADLLKEYNQKDIPVSASDSAENNSEASKKGSSQSFSPTPLNMTPSLGPRSSIKDVDDKKDE
ncbi:hypothetical protein N9L02_02195 [Gammaproteobacteria bacterium]|nr:hypothetical protein [Gammaproteobacteria bacterium]